MGFGYCLPNQENDPGIAYGLAVGGLLYCVAVRFRPTAFFVYFSQRVDNGKSSVTNTDGW